MRRLPTPSPSFTKRKDRILQQLSIPDSEYTDASPKGSIDAGIRHLIDGINRLDGFVTTSSCAGRVSVFVEGKKATDPEQQARLDEGYDQEQVAPKPAQIAGVGGKGGGGSWLFVSHDPVPLEEGPSRADLDLLLGLRSSRVSGQRRIGEDGSSESPTRLIHFKFEPMAGFRESGAINLTANAGEPVTPIVAIRSMGLALESLIGMQTQGVPQRTVSAEYLENLLRIANERFAANTERIERFRLGVLEATQPPKKKDGTEWEDAQTRRERKRAEGLKRKAEFQKKELDTGQDGAYADSYMTLNADMM
ncbi:hypothetical protein DL764_002709 [Monosporascus ibericus]|uniref:tRNA(Phe) 7-[(3-amino-3-carboxypropyl)-4-demethylwyosine(37)-N(4)]-methyltransferase n=1 Tax=Monosporascus ibericus TaxID=155417 RepID=A0A4Q4TL60_9PEZI|nr:hypothetical protein DL764_002709 [Monosporascus ibericus]